MGDDEKGIEQAKATCGDLVDRFYRENEEIMASSQFEVEKKDFEYFMRLVNLAIAFFRDRSDDDKWKTMQRTS